MKTAYEILDDELSQHMIEKMAEIPLMREWIKDAMCVFAEEYHKDKVKELNSLDVIPSFDSLKNLVGHSNQKNGNYICKCSKCGGLFIGNIHW